MTATAQPPSEFAAASGCPNFGLEPRVASTRDPVRSGVGGAYYNEHDKRAAAWLRALIAEGVIAPGVVDERSITEIKAHELDGYTQCHFFAGLGGWSYALRLAHWPDSGAVWTGSCPCQPFSAAGKGEVDKDERHLWPAFRELVAKCRPAICFGEQVASSDGRIWLAGVRADLEALGYGVGAADLCAAGVSAPHIRQRLYWLAYARGERRQQIPRGASRDENADGRAGRNGREPNGNHQPASDGENRGGMDDSADSRRAGGGQREEAGTARHETRLLEPTRSSASGGLGNASGAERRPQAEGRNDELHGADAGREEAAGGLRLHGAWSDFGLVACADGKSRRVESGTFPLAHGVPGRVGLLRGYGNAIVPQVAAEFVSASVEAIPLVRWAAGAGVCPWLPSARQTAALTVNSPTREVSRERGKSRAACGGGSACRATRKT